MIHRPQDAEGRSAVDPQSTPPSIAGDGAELQRLRALVYVPGLWRCAKCQFQLVQANLNAGDGSVTARDRTGDKCPNCNVPLWRVTERDAGNDLVDQLIAVHAERDALRAANDWRPIASLPTDSDEMIIAGCPPDADFPEGRVMIWRADLLTRNLKGPTPDHLQFPATHWKPRPAAPGCER